MHGFGIHVAIYFIDVVEAEVHSGVCVRSLITDLLGNAFQSPYDCPQIAKKQY